MSTIYLDTEPLKGMVDYFFERALEDTLKDEIVLGILECYMYGYVAQATAAPMDLCEYWGLARDRARQLSETLHEMIYRCMSQVSIEVPDTQYPQHSHYVVDKPNPTTMIIHKIPLGDQAEDPMQHIRDIVRESEDRGDWVPERLRRMVGEL